MVLSLSLLIHMKSLSACCAMKKTTLKSGHAGHFPIGFHCSVRPTKQCFILTNSICKRKPPLIFYQILLLKLNKFPLKYLTATKEHSFVIIMTFHYNLCPFLYSIHNFFLYKLKGLGNWDR